MRYTFLFLFVFSNIVCSYGQEWAVKLDSVLKIIAKDELFDGQVLIAEHGNIVFDKAYGHLSDGTAITCTTPLAVKSITKGFTAAAILNLAQEGKLNLSDEVSVYIPNWPYKGMTIRHLLSMSSGLPNFLEKAIEFADTTKYMTNQDIIKLIVAHPVAVRPSGYYYKYQNSNYITLAAIIENISGKSYTDYIIENLFKPLKLEHTYLEDLTSNEKQADGDTFYAPYGDGNLHSTAEDLFRFEQSFYGNDILRKTYVDSTFQKTRLHDGSLSKYGLGWWVIDNQPKTEYYILGDGPNIRASIQRFPDTHSTLIFIHNVSGRNWHDVYWVVRNIWYGNEFKMPVKSDLSRYDIDIKLYDNYVGSYLSKGFGLLHVTKEDDKLYVRPDPIPGKEELIPSSDTTFYFADKSVEWEFFLNEDGSVKGFGFKGKPETIGIKQNK